MPPLITTIVKWLKSFLWLFLRFFSFCIYNYYYFFIFLGKKNRRFVLKLSYSPNLKIKTSSSFLRFICRQSANVNLIDKRIFAWNPQIVFCTEACNTFTGVSIINLLCFMTELNFPILLLLNFRLRCDVDFYQFSLGTTLYEDHTHQKEILIKSLYFLNISSSSSLAVFVNIHKTFFYDFYFFLNKTKKFLLSFILFFFH